MRDELEDLITAIYEFRDRGTYRDMNKDGSRTMDAKQFSKFLIAFYKFEASRGIDSEYSTMYDRRSIVNSR